MTLEELFQMLAYTAHVQKIAAINPIDKILGYLEKDFYCYKDWSWDGFLSTSKLYDINAIDKLEKKELLVFPKDDSAHHNFIPTQWYPVGAYLNSLGKRELFQREMEKYWAKNKKENNMYTRFNVNFKGNNHPSVIVDVNIQKEFGLDKDSWDKLDYETQQMILLSFFTQRMVIDEVVDR